MQGILLLWLLAFAFCCVIWYVSNDKEQKRVFLILFSAFTCGIWTLYFLGSLADRGEIPATLGETLLIAAAAAYGAAYLMAKWTWEPDPADIQEAARKWNEERERERRGKRSSY